MKIGRNDLCPCGSGKKYKNCCLNNATNSVSVIKYLEEKPSNFAYIDDAVKKCTSIFKGYRYDDLVKAVYCVNAWRRNRSALAQRLILNKALIDIRECGKKEIVSYNDFIRFFEKIAPFLTITVYEDEVIDDFGEIFINHLGITYPVITGTGHLQVFAAFRYMQTLALIHEKENELKDILEYMAVIIDYLKVENIPATEGTIQFEYPSESFWKATNTLFDEYLLAQNIYEMAVYRQLGYQIGPIEMRHFVQHNGKIYPLFNESILVDYYKKLLLTSSKQQVDNHITETILRLLDNSFNFSPNKEPEILLQPVIIEKEDPSNVLFEKLFAVGFGSSHILIILDKRQYDNENKLNEALQQINNLNANKELSFLERYPRENGHYGVTISKKDIIFMVINPHTDITENFFMLKTKNEVFECTALDFMYMFGFCSDITEIIEYILFTKENSTHVYSFGGESNYFLSWKKANRVIFSGAIETENIILDYNTAEEYVYSYFKNNMLIFPNNNDGLFIDPLHWTIENGRLGYTRIIHKGNTSFGGNIRKFLNGGYLFLAHNGDFYQEEDLVVEYESLLLVIDELNQKLFNRYDSLINDFEILKGKTLQILFIPWKYANSHYSKSLFCDPEREIVYSDLHHTGNYAQIRYTVKPGVLLEKIQSAENRVIENLYFQELLLPLRLYEKERYDILRDSVNAHALFKKTVGVFTLEQEYYFSDKAIDTEISSVSFAKARKEIAKICKSSGIAPGEYCGKGATKIVRKMQETIVAVFETLLKKYECYSLHNIILNYYAIQKNGEKINLRRFFSFENLDDEVLQEFEKQTIISREEYRRYCRTAEYLLESNLAIKHDENNKKCTKDEFNYLLAFADWLIVLQDNSDICHYTDKDVSLYIDEEYKISVVQNDASQKKYDELCERKYKVRDYSIKGDTTDEAFIKKVQKAFFDDTGVEMPLLMGFLEYLQLDVIRYGPAKEIYPNIFEVSKDQLINDFNDNLVEQTDVENIIKVIDYLVLDTDSLKSVDGYIHEILPIWEREKRDNRFEVKPILLHNNICVFSPVSINNLLHIWRSAFAYWHLPYEVGLTQMDKALKEWKKRYEDEMVQDIAKLFHNARFDMVFSDIELCSRFPRDDYPKELGDYDTMAFNYTTKEVWIIESKVLQKVGSVYEDQMQQKSFFVQNVYDEKFQRRIDFMRNNIDKVLKSFGIREDGYTVVPYMVTNKLFSSRYKEITFPIITFSELEIAIKEKYT